MFFDNYDVVQKIVTKLKALPDLFTALVQKVDANSQAVENALTTSDIANNLTTETAGKVLDASQGYELDTAVKKSGLTWVESHYSADAQEFNFEADPSTAYIIIVVNFGGKTPSAFLVNAMSSSGAFKIVSMASGTVTATLTSVDYKTLKIETETYCSVKILKVHE